MLILEAWIERAIPLLRRDLGRAEGVVPDDITGLPASGLGRAKAEDDEDRKEDLEELLLGQFRQTLVKPISN